MDINWQASGATVLTLPNLIIKLSTYHHLYRDTQWIFRLGISREVQGVRGLIKSFKSWPSIIFVQIPQALSGWQQVDSAWVSISRVIIPLISSLCLTQPSHSRIIISLPERATESRRERKADLKMLYELLEYFDWESSNHHFCFS